MKEMMGLLFLAVVAMAAAGEVIFKTDFAKGDFEKLHWKVEGEWAIVDYKAGEKNPGQVARFAANKGTGKLTRSFNEVRNPKKLALSLDVGWGLGDAGQGSDSIVFLLLDPKGNGYVFHVGRANAKWAVQWAPVKENDIPKDRHWAPEEINGNLTSVRDGGGLQTVVVTRERDGSWKISCGSWNGGAGGSVTFTDKTTTSFSQVVLLGTENFDEQVFNNIVLDVTK